MDSTSNCGGPGLKRKRSPERYDAGLSKEDAEPEARLQRKILPSSGARVEPSDKGFDLEHTDAFDTESKRSNPELHDAVPSEESEGETSQVPIAMLTYPPPRPRRTASCTCEESLTSDRLSSLMFYVQLLQDELDPVRRKAKAVDEDIGRARAAIRRKGFIVRGTGDGSAAVDPPRFVWA
ncbi:hypothetical protein K438DRAFT_1748024 [Mycena galopus ATCC 62051]|nr:hypothetical protein K438DRAFT_1748024 [Mycena galopus ATCC 62051]